MRISAEMHAHRSERRRAPASEERSGRAEERTRIDALVERARRLTAG